MVTVPIRYFRTRHEAVAETHTDRSAAIQRLGFLGFIPGPVTTRLTDRCGRALVIRFRLLLFVNADSNIG